MYWAHFGNPIAHAWLYCQLENEVTAAHETSDAFSAETLKEQAVFEHAKRAEMKEILGEMVDGQIEMYQQVRTMLFDSEQRMNSEFLSQGDERLGFDYPDNATHSCGRLIPVIPPFLSPVHS